MLTKRNRLNTIAQRMSNTARASLVIANRKSTPIHRSFPRKATKLRVNVKLYCTSAIIAAIGGLLPSLATADNMSIAPRLGGKTFQREHRLPLCEWAPDRDNMRQVMHSFDVDNVYWYCKNGQSQCDWTGTRPSNSSYRVAGSYYDDPYFYGGEMTWPDGTKLYSTWGVGCTKAAQGDRDIVTSHMLQGHIITWPTPPGAPHVPSVLADVDGGIVEHLRAAKVLAIVQLGRDPVYQYRVENDVVLAIQVATPGGWEDVATQSFTSEGSLQTFRLETHVEPGEAVRLQVRGTWRIAGNQLGTGYELRDARLLVETCIPDQSNPDSPVCL
jgi:hypothetical protein